MKRYILLAAAVLSVAACNKGEMTPDTDTRVALQVTSGIQTRAYDATWEAGDDIGIFGFTQGDASTQAYSNVRYVTTGGDGAFTPDGTTIYLPTDGSSLDFVAYYPYTATAMTDGVYTVNVTDQSDQSAIDFMAAGTQTADRSKNTVTFNFEHKLSKIVLTFKPGDGMALSELTGMKVQLTNQQTKALFDVTKPDGEVVVGTNTPATLTLDTDADGTSSEGIVLPSANFDGMTLHLELSNGSSFFNWDLNNSKADKFEAGKKYVYDITVNKSRLDVTATITDWTPGNGEGGESGEAIIPVPLGNISDPAEVLKGDLAMSDGTFLRSDDFSTLSDEQIRGVRGIVFWTYDGSYPDTDLAGDKVLMTDFPECSHGLIVSLKDASQSQYWSSSSSYYASIYEWQKSASFNGYTEVAAISPADEEMENECNRLLGYNNTMVILAYNEYCNTTGGLQIFYKCYLGDTIGDFRDANQTLEGASDWYIPSVKELALLTDEDSNGNIWSLDGNTYKYINEILTEMIDLGVDAEILGTGYYWSSTEASQARTNDPVQRAYCADLKNGVIGKTGQYKKNKFRVRTVCAF